MQLSMLAAGDVAGDAVGWADARTHDWLQQQQLLQGQRRLQQQQRQLFQQQQLLQQQLQRQQVQLFGQMQAQAPAVQQQLPPPAAASTPAAAAAGCRSSPSASCSGLVLERLGSKEAALKQLQLLQRNPASAKQLVQSLKAWQASPEAAAAAKVAARCSGGS
jgi:hypothetical protein